MLRHTHRVVPLYGHMFCVGAYYTRFSRMMQDKARTDICACSVAHRPRPRHPDTVRPQAGGQASVGRGSLRWWDGDARVPPHTRVLREVEYSAYSARHVQLRRQTKGGPLPSGAPLPPLVPRQYAANTTAFQDACVCRPTPAPLPRPHPCAYPRGLHHAQHETFACTLFFADPHSEAWIYLEVVAE